MNDIIGKLFPYFGGSGLNHEAKLSPHIVLFSVDNHTNIIKFFRFCKPADIDTEDGQHDGGPGKLSGGTGLGDGEGQTDVSERIENQVSAGFEFFRRKNR